jgi:hypothetical protein
MTRSAVRLAALVFDRPRKCTHLEGALLPWAIHPLWGTPYKVEMRR